MATIAASLLVAGAAPAATTLQSTPLSTLSPSTEGSDPSRAVDAGGVGYLSAYDSDHGTELYRFDGSAAPRLVKDIAPGDDSSSPTSFVPLGSDLFFAARDDAHGEELWRSDGTAVGTTLVKDIRPGGADSQISQPVASGGKLYFSADDGTGSDRQLWVSDGTAAGTHLVKNINASGASIGGLTPYRGGVAFSAYDGTDWELWTSDGTASGTTKVDVAPGPDSSNPVGFAVIGTTLYFAANDGLGHSNVELYKSDGTTASRVKDLDGSPSTGSYPSSLTAVGSTLFFRVDSGELWSSDGTAAGTTVVHSGVPTSVDDLTAFGGKLHFTGEDATNGRELWSTDGTNVGTAIVKDVNPAAGQGSEPQQLTVVGSHLNFLADPDGNGTQLWTTDGTTAGTTAVFATSGNANDLSAVGGLLSFDDDDGIHGEEPYVSDNTAAGTALHDVNATGVATPSAPVTLGGVQLFTAAVQANGTRRVFVTDGTAAGTRVLTATRPSYNTRDIVLMGGKAYFFGRDGNDDTALFSTDGTEAGTVEVRTVSFYDAPDLTAVGDRLYFAGEQGFNTSEPWVSDGTTAGTGPLADLNPTGMSHPAGFTALGTKVVFSAWRGSSGTGVAWGEYVSDGTTAGTVRLSPIADVGGAVGAAAAFGGKVYFSANGHLWATDGTTGGTAEVTSALTVTGGSINFAVAGGKLYFNADDGGGARLFTYDGSGSPVAVAPTGATATGLTPFGTGALFTYRDTQELGVTDGTAAGTHGLGATVADQDSLVAAGTTAYFTGQDDGHGAELWKTDGTAAGTVLATDLLAGPSSSHAKPLWAVGDDVVASFDQPGTGTVLSRFHTVTTPDGAGGGGGDTQSGGGTTTTTTTTTKPATTTTPMTKPAPPATGRAKARRLSLTVGSTAGRRPPFRIAISGKLARPTGVPAKAACSGTVTITARRGDVKVASVAVRLRADCTYRATLIKHNMKHLAAHGGKLRLVARFSGNAALLPARSATRTSRYGG